MRTPPIERRSPAGRRGGRQESGFALPVYNHFLPTAIISADDLRAPDCNGNGQRFNSVINGACPLNWVIA